MTANRVAIALSGAGRSLRNFLNLEKNFAYEVAAVISSNERCKGVSIAKEHNLPVFIGDFSGDKNLPNNLENWLKKNNIDWIALAGFLKPFPVISAYRNKIINIHPALLPKYGGKGMHGIHVHRAVKQAGDKVSGATVHFVNENYDEGEIIEQTEIDIAHCSTAELIADHVFSVECILYPKTLHQLILSDKK